MDLKNSQTKDNLMRAFAGESQARNRYLFAASQAKKEKLHVIQAVFEYTADQERAHAKVYYDHLKELAGSNISVDGSYPVDIYDNMVQLLRAAQHNEYEEHDDVYAKFGEIAEIEKTHGDRFGKFADYMEEGKLFLNDEKTEWLCLNCGHIHNSAEAPKSCPVCNHPQGFFIRLGMSPFN